MRPETTLFFDVDTQRDFILPTGRLYAAGAERIVPTLAALTQLARRRGIRIAGHVDRHFPGDPELQRNGGLYPDHCMNGSDGQRKIDETAPLNPFWVENRALSQAEIDAALAHRGELFFEKQHIDLFLGNRNAATLLPRLLENVTDVVIYGLCTDICIDLSVRRLIPYGRTLHVVGDATAALDAERARQCMAQWRDQGVELLTFAELEPRLEA